MMKHIWFLVFTSQLAFALAVFNLKEIVPGLKQYQSVTWELSENSFKVCNINN